MDTRIKSALILSMIVCVLLEKSPHLCAGIAILSIAATLASGVPPRRCGVRLIPVVLLAVVVTLIRFVASSDAGSAPMSNNGVSSVAAVAGMETGLLLGMKMIGAVSTALMLALTTPLHEMFRALAWFRLPSLFLDIAQLMVHYLFVFADEAARIRRAQQIRLGYVGIRRSVASTSVLAGILLIRAFDKTRDRYQAVQLRGGLASWRPEPYPLGSVGAAKLFLALFGPLCVWASIQEVWTR